MFWHFYSKPISCVSIALLALFMTPATVLAGDAAESGDAMAGKGTYSSTCIACHGANGKGTIPGVSDFTKIDGPLAKSDDELAKSISEGLATPGAALTMPAKGGNPSLTGSDIVSLIAYLRYAFGR
jgi:mono/diheme cytochrome c family protein